MPSDTDVVFERFFDEGGGQQLIVHAPFGSGVNRAWGLALRKRFCVRFDFELQAAANEEGISALAGPDAVVPARGGVRVPQSRTTQSSRCARPCFTRRSGTLDGAGPRLGRWPSRDGAAPRKCRPICRE